MGFPFPKPLSVWSDELSVSILLKGAGLGLFLSTGAVVFVNYMEANIVYVYALFGVIITSLLADILFSELRLFAATHPPALAPAPGFQLETARALQIQPILEADVLGIHICNPDTLKEITDPDLIGLIRRNYYIFRYLHEYLKTEAEGCLHLIKLKGEIAVSSTMLRVLVNAINVSKVTRDVDATLQHFDREPVKRMLMDEQKKLFRSMKEYVEERVRAQTFNSLRNLHTLLEKMADEYD